MKWLHKQSRFNKTYPYELIPYKRHFDWFYIRNNVGHSYIFNTQQDHYCSYLRLYQTHLKETDHNIGYVSDDSRTQVK